MKEQIQPNLNWPPGTVRNSFVAEVLSQNLKTNRRNNLHEVLLKGLRAQSPRKVLFKGPIMYPTLQMTRKCCKRHVFDTF